MRLKIKIFIAFAAAALVGVAALIPGIMGVNFAFADMINPSELSADNLPVDALVKGDILEVWNMYAREDDSSGNISTAYFAMPLNSMKQDEAPVFITVIGRAKNTIEGLGQMDSEMTAYYNNGEAPASWTKISFQGQIDTLPDDVYEMLCKYVEDTLGYETGLGKESVLPFALVEYGDEYFSEQSGAKDFVPLLIAGIALIIVGFTGAVISLVTGDAGDYR